MVEGRKVGKEENAHLPLETYLDELHHCFPDVMHAYAAFLSDEEGEGLFPYDVHTGLHMTTKLPRQEVQLEREEGITNGIMERTSFEDPPNFSRPRSRSAHGGRRMRICF